MNGSEAFPWSVLGLDPAAATERDVKRAYAMLVKQHRPDRDPDGFQHIRGAYEAALTQLQQTHGAIEMPSPSVDEPESMPAERAQGPPAPPALPEEFMAAESGMRQALLQADNLRLQQCMGRMRELSWANPALVGAWEQSLLQTFEKDFTQLAHSIRDEDVQLMIRERREHLPEAMLGFWHASGCTLQMVALADFLLAQKPPFDFTATVLLQARLSLYLAFANIPKAEQLTNAVFPLMPPQMRDWILPRLENRLAIAKIFRTLPAESRRFWGQNLCPDEDETIVWNEPELRTQFRELTMRCPADWPGYQILSDAIPKPLFNRLTLQFRPQPPKIQSATLTKEPTFPKFFFHLLIILALFAFRNIHSCSDSHQHIKYDKDLNLRPVLEKYRNSDSRDIRDLPTNRDKNSKDFTDGFLEINPRPKQ